MQTNRYNSLTMIHKALRGMLYDAALKMQQLSFTDAEAASPVLEKVARILFLFDDHANHEDNMLFPHALQFSPELVDELEKEHVTDHSLSAELRESIAAYRSAAGPAERIQAGNKITSAFNEFIAFNLQHMNKEETKLHHILWENYTDQDIMAMNQKVAARVPPDIAFENISWMMRTCSDTDIVPFLKGVRRSAPEHLANIVMQVATKELAPERWEAMQQQLAEEMPA
jgi:hemerythrin-like domain-containing protein